MSLKTSENKTILAEGWTQILTLPSEHLSSIPSQMLFIQATLPRGTERHLGNGAAVLRERLELSTCSPLLPPSLLWHLGLPDVPLFLSFGLWDLEARSCHLSHLHCVLVVGTDTQTFIQSVPLLYSLFSLLVSLHQVLAFLCLQKSLDHRGFTDTTQSGKAELSQPVGIEQKMLLSLLLGGWNGLGLDWVGLD